MNKENKFSNNEEYSPSQIYNVAIIANIGTIFGLYIIIIIFICISIFSTQSTGKCKKLRFYFNIYTHLKQLINSLIETKKNLIRALLAIFVLNNVC